MLGKGSALASFQGRLLWTQIVSVYTPKLSQQYVRTMDLTTKQEIFPPLKIKTYRARQVSTRLQYATVSPERNLAVVFRQLVDRRPPLPAGTPDFAFESYDTRTGQLLVEFWSGKDQRNPDAGGRPVDVALISGSPYIVGAINASIDPQSHGGLIVWDARTGAVVQRTPGPSAQRVSASPDGKRLVLFCGRSLLVYRRHQ